MRPPRSIPGGVGQAPCLWGGARHDAPGQSCRMQSRQEMPLSRPRSNATRSEWHRRGSPRVEAGRLRSPAHLASNCDAGASALRIARSDLQPLDGSGSLFYPVPRYRDTTNNCIYTITAAKPREISCAFRDCLKKHL